MLRTLERVSLGFWFAIYKLRNTRFNEFSVWFFVCPNEIRGVPFFTKSNRVKAYTRETRLMFKQTPPMDTVNNEPHFAISTQRTYIEIHRKFLACFMNRLYRASFSLNHHAFWWQIIPGSLFFFFNRLARYIIRRTTQNLRFRLNTKKNSICVFSLLSRHNWLMSHSSTHNCKSNLHF